LHQASGLAQLPGFLLAEGQTMKTYFGFGIAPSMFPDNCVIIKKKIDPEMAVSIVDEERKSGRLVYCFNPSHLATIQVMTGKYGIEGQIPHKAPAVSLVNGDRIIVMGVSGLPRLEGRHEYTPDEIAEALFTFTEWCVFTLSGT